MENSFDRADEENRRRREEEARKNMVNPHGTHNMETEHHPNHSTDYCEFCGLSEHDPKIINECRSNPPTWPDLHGGDPNCAHDIRTKELWEGGGVECRKCKGWFCF